jgi:hypothetical protein
MECNLEYYILASCCTQNRQTTRKAKQANTHTRIRKLTKKHNRKTNENVQEYKSETSYTLEDGHVGRNM